MKRTTTISTTRRAVMTLLVTMLTTMTAWAQTNVSDAHGLERAFDDPNVSVINVTDNITGVGGLSLDRALTINLNGHTISGDGLNFDVGPDRSLTINGGGQGGSVGNIISGNAYGPAIDNTGTVTLSHVNITTNADLAIFGPGTLNIGNNVSFNGWTDMPFRTPNVNTESGNYNYDPENYNPFANLVATVTVGGKTHYFENSDAALAYIVSHPDNDDFSLSGDTYTIKSANGWDLFCALLAQHARGYFSGKTVELANDISVTRMAGLEGHEFQGTFDGNKKTLTVSISNSNGNAAPFREIMGATIRNLKVSGSVSGHKHSAGLVSYARGADSSVENTIENCLVATDVSTIVDTDGDCYLGGIVGHGFNCKLTIRGCAFTGSLTSPHNYTGGLQGWSDGNTLVLENDLFAASSVNAANVGFHPIAIHANNKTTTATVTNVYYTVAPTCTAATRIAAAGKQARSITAGENVTIDAIALTGDATQYTVSGITAYSGGGLQRGETLYYGIDDNVSLTLSNTATGAPDGYQYGYTTNAGTLEGSTLTMPDQDVTVSVNTDDLVAIDWATVSTGADKDNAYMIYNNDQLDLLAHRVNGTHGETCQTDGYSGKYFKLGKDIKYTHKANGEEGAATESNYEAIGGYYNDGYRYFRGHFDGNNNTISGIRIYKNGISDADRYQGIFGLTDGADIHHLTLADARITGYDDTGGIVGDNYGGTVSRCHVADDVAVYAVQPNVWYHGGIVGYNTNGTIEQCTSAATLTTADATSTQYYGGIAGGNYGTLSDNLAIGATVPAAANNTYGAITGYNNDGFLLRNYYTACKVADTENATGVGCGYIDDGNGGYTTADVTADNGAVSIHTLTLADGITTTTAATVTIGTTGYYAQGTAIDLSYSGTIGDGYQLAIVSNDGNGSNAATADGSGNYTAVMPAANATATDHAPIDWATVSTGADKDNAYMIYNNDQLDLLAHRVNGTHGETRRDDGYSGKYFKLAKDIKYTHTSDWDDFDSDESNYEAIGGYYNDSYRSFRGHFDGNNKTISGIRIYKNGSGFANDYQGIFGLTDGADIHHLTLADARITGYDFTGGIVGENYGTVSGCHLAGDVAVCAVQSDACYHGGIVGYNNTGTIEQCSSAATLTNADATSTQYYGGIAGYTYRGTLSDNLAIGATVPAVSDNSYGAITGCNNNGTLQRNYYAACKVADVENATGVGCNNADVTANNGAVSIHTLTLADGITTSTAATVTIGTTGYYAQGTAITLSYSGTIGDGYQLAIVSNDGNGSNAATADGSGNYTAVMPAADATATDHAPIDWATVSTGADKDNAYMIYNKDQLDLLAHRVNGTHGETAVEDGYSGKYFKLAKDISYPHKADGEEGSDAENNYEAIGGYYGDVYRSFLGHFDGNNKTISGIRIYKNGDGNADRYQGIFGLTDSGADIHNLTLADARITGYDDTGGIVGDNYGGTVSRCHVAGDVAVCAVQYNAWYHGGIVGSNFGTIEECTSAATLTTADADNSGCYGGIAGYNSYGTLSDNLAIGATVPAAADNNYGAITGYNDGGSLLRNYYAACKMADTENATGVGCGYISDGNGGYTTADVTANDGAVSIHTLTLADGITTTTAATVTIGTTGYYAQGTAIDLNYSGTTGEGYQLGIVRNDGNGSNAATADGSGNYTAVMPAADATATDHAPIDWATVSTGADKDNAYIIYNKDQLDLLAYRVNGTHGETRQTDSYSGKYFQLAKDISYPHKGDGEEGADTENNYEAIGGVYNGGYRYFRGHFDGNNKTISGIRIYKGGDDAADYHQGIFGRTDSGADIHHLTLADARITGFNFTGGIVGFNGGGTVTRCHVAADVAVCAVQSGALDHGGIAGLNSGTIEQCTSAATLTTADASNSKYYGGIAGYNDGGILRDNLAIGATVPAAKDNTYGAITGYNNGKVTLQRNYYAACTVAGTENATGVGCNNADVTANDGAVPALRDGADNSTALALMAAVPEKFGTYSVSLNGRTLSKSGDWNTLCLPFDIDDFSGTPLEGATVKELLTTSNLDSDGQLTLYFTAASSIKAGKPYIVKWEKPDGYDDADPETRDVKNPVFSGVTVSSTTPTAVNFTGGSFVGQYSPFSIGDTSSGTFDGDINEIIMLGTGNKLGYSKSARTLRSFRCHFYVPAEGSEPGARAFVLDFDGETTEIISPAEIKEITEMAGAWYSLDGRKLDAKPTKKGVYIRNGKKIVIK